MPFQRKVYGIHFGIAVLGIKGTSSFPHIKPSFLKMLVAHRGMFKGNPTASVMVINLTIDGAMVSLPIF